MPLITVADTKDLSPVLKLKQLVERKRIQRFGTTHLYGEGFRALSDILRGRRLSPQRGECFARLHQDATLLLDIQSDWGAHQKRLVAAICSEHECQALAFELNVIRYAVRPNSRDFRWLRFEQGTPDIISNDPAFWMECKLIRNATELPKILQILHKSHAQHSNVECSYVIAIGFARDIEARDARMIPQVLARYESWFLNHPKLSGVLVFAPSSERKATLLGVVTDAFQSGVITQCLNSASTFPLPYGFSFHPAHRLGTVVVR